MKGKDVVWGNKASYHKYQRQFSSQAQKNHVLIMERTRVTSQLRDSQDSQGPFGKHIARKGNISPKHTQHPQF